jgi:F-type H+-transporting ATPase subunit epsilon
MAFELTIVTPEGERFAGPVEAVVLPGSEGEFGVLEGHERFLSPLRIGSAEIRAGGATHWAALAEGFADVSGERVVVLVETCELAEDIDVARAERARGRAREALDGLTGSDGDQAQRPGWEADLARAEVRLAVAARLPG